MSPTTTHPMPSHQARPAARPAPERPANGFGFFLFLLVNAALFVRPADAFPGWEGLEIYRYLLLACLAISFPAVLSRLSPTRLERSPVDLFVLLLLPVIFMSHVAHYRTADGADEAFAYFKIVVYYLLLVSLVTTSGRMKTFLGLLIVCAALTTVMSILDFEKVIQLPRPVAPAGSVIHKQKIDQTRMYGPGIFNDPNDICVLIGSAVLLLWGKASDKSANSTRWLWLSLLPVFGYGFYLTQSRGGMLAFLVGAGVVVILRWGWARAILLGGAAVPLLIIAIAGSERMSSISAEDETGQGRIQLWSSGLVMLRNNPVFGVGQNRYHEEAGQVAHNSFMQQFGDTGLPGGMLYLGMVATAIWTLYRHASPVGLGRQTRPRVFADPGFARLHPFLAGAVVCYAAGMMTLSMNTLVTTYAFVGLASIFVERALTYPDAERPRVDIKLALSITGLTFLFLAAMFVFIRLTFSA